MASANGVGSIDLAPNPAHAATPAAETVPTRRLTPFESVEPSVGCITMRTVMTAHTAKPPVASSNASTSAPSDAMVAATPTLTASQKRRRGWPVAKRGSTSGGVASTSNVDDVAAASRSGEPSANVASAGGGARVSIVAIGGARVSIVAIAGGARVRDRRQLYM